MTGPLPPHERPWRHPSELPAPPHEPPSRSGRLLIFGTATVGLLLVGVLALRMTPGRSAVTSDAVVGATSTSAALVDFTSEPVSAVGTAAGDTFVDVDVTETFTRIVETLAALPSATTAVTDASEPSPPEAPPTGQPNEAAAPVTPVGAGGYGVTTAAALDGRSGPIEAVLPSGSVVPAEVVGVEEGVAVVALDGGDSEAIEFSEFAQGAQSEELTVVVQGQSMPVHGDELAASGAAEGAPILDDQGGLVGLATIGDDGAVQMLPLTSLPDVGPPTTAPESSAVESSAPASEPTEPTMQPSTSSEPATSTSAPSSTEPGSTTSTTTTTTTTTTTSSSEPVESSTTVAPPTTVEMARRITPGDATV